MKYLAYFLTIAFVYAQLHGVEGAACYGSGCEDAISKEGRCAGKRAGVYCLDEKTRLICPDDYTMGCASILTRKRILLEGRCQSVQGDERTSSCKLVFTKGPCKDKSPGTYCIPAGLLTCKDDGDFTLANCSCDFKTNAC